MIFRQPVPGVLAFPREASVFGQCDGDFREPAQLLAIASDFRHHLILDLWISGILECQRGRKSRRGNPLIDITGQPEAKYPERIKAAERIGRHAKQAVASSHQRPRLMPGW